MSDIEYFLITEADIPEIRAFVKEVVLPREPITLCVHATPDEVITYFMDGIDQCIKNNGKIQFGARDPNSGKLVGLRINHIITKEHKKSPWALAKCTNDKERIFRDIFIELESYPVKTCENMDPIFEFCLLAVDANYSGRGIGKKLVMLSEELAVKEGIKVGMVLTSNIRSQSIFTKLGYKTEYTFDYATFELGGKRVFDPVPAGELCTKGFLIQSKLF